MSQLQLACEANISSRHLSFIETGRGHASVDTLMTIARYLQIPFKEQNRILLSAGYAPRYGETGLSDAALSQARWILERILASHEPYPAFAVDGSWNILITNSAHDRLFRMIVSVEQAQEIGGNNLMRFLFHPRGLCKAIANWDALWPIFFDEVKRQRAMQPHNRQLGALVDEILGWTKDSRIKAGDAFQGTEHFALPITFHIAGRTLTFVSTGLTFAAPLSATLQGLVLETFYPKDSDSDREVRRLLA